MLGLRKWSEQARLLKVIRSVHASFELGVCFTSLALNGRETNHQRLITTEGLPTAARAPGSLSQSRNLLSKASTLNPKPKPSTLNPSPINPKAQSQTLNPNAPICILPNNPAAGSVGAQVRGGLFLNTRGNLHLEKKTTASRTYTMGA